ncbi:DUF1559 domain-containing protein, partial [bacterium]|nr:DUF1559 domain-containing protein [bacterium]
MYEFPTRYQKAATFDDIFFTLLVLILWSGAIYWIHKRHLFFKQFSLTLFSAMALLATYLLSAITFSPPEYQYISKPAFYGVSILYVWIIAGCGALINLHRLKTHQDPTMVAKSFRELLVIAFTCLILVFIASLPLSAFKRVRYANRRPRCLSNMRNLGIAIHTYATEHRGDIPATAEGEPPRGWRVELLPFIEQQKLRESY